MGSRGPSRTPTAKLKLVGSHLVKGREGTEPTPPADVPESSILLTATERKIYDTALGWLRSMNLQASTDGNALARYAKSVVRYNEVAAHVRDNGDVLEGRRSHESKILTELEAVLLRLEREFGLTPSARASLQVEKPRESGRASFIG